MFLVASCSDTLDVKPRLQIDSATALTNETAVNAAVNSVYDALQSTFLYGRDLIAIPEALSDNGRATNKSGRLVPEWQNQPGSHLANWGQAYYAINQANLILKALPTVTMAQANKDNVEGQCLFLRALLYFDLMRAYAYAPKAVISQQDRGGVPIVLDGVLDLSQVTFPNRPSIDDSFKQINADLTNAITKLANVAVSRAPFYVTRGAAQALASRVALYAGDWANANKFATDALASGVGRFQTTATYVSSWRTASNPESMFEINYQTNENIGVNTSIQTTYTTLVQVGNRTQTGGFGDLVPTASLLADMEAEKNATGQVLDVRRQLYELGTAGRGTAEIECTKFLGKNGQVNLDNVPVIRISEMYLNRAEANFNLQNEAEALKDLNVIRTRAGLPEAKDLTGAALLTEILKQRRIELAFEGSRFFDLKRLGRTITKAPANLEFSDFKVLARIPVGEIAINPSLRQNFGY